MKLVILQKNIFSHETKIKDVFTNNCKVLVINIHVILLLSLIFRNTTNFQLLVMFKNEKNILLTFKVKIYKYRSITIQYMSHRVLAGYMALCFPSKIYEYVPWAPFKSSLKTCLSAIKVAQVWPSNLGFPILWFMKLVHMFAYHNQTKGFTSQCMSYFPYTTEHCMHLPNTNRVITNLNSGRFMFIVSCTLEH